ncbi:hypothetical protein SNOG_01855 [Parastagonospora nodorum SN15]|uniref:Uncharacterized protein n=1 Tax=Phaeosphaeria nodorum (strain SN15 / ATCC MYA-4574 / FGSC 10173) TaxID=321614 RepID=Q0V2A9_PHANO|nr:hypothetical protein SNOG_01855 [Parastagonospora nodorum SN15]EAT90067.1 hypothetical protein SNOG_01855 [Parastagonospora nodorum SN15]
MATSILRHPLRRADGCHTSSTYQHRGQASFVSGVVGWHANAVHKRSLSSSAYNSATLPTTTSTPKSAHASLAMKKSAMCSRKVKAHIFPNHKRSAKQPNTRASNRVMSMESLTARLALVPNKTTKSPISSCPGTETRARMTSPATNVTRSLGTSDGEDPAHAIPAADEHLDTIPEAIVKPDSVIETIPNVLTTPDFNTEGMINGAVWLVLEDRDVGEGTGGDEDCDNDENYGSDEKSDCDHQRHHHPHPLQASAIQATGKRKDIELQGHQASNSRCTRVGLPPLSVTPAPGTALGLLGPSSVPTAFLSTYTNEVKIARIEPYGVPEVPAYARSSMSSWFHSPANSSIQGTVQGLPLPTRRRRTHQVEPRPFARNKNEITPHNKPEVPKEGPTPWVKRLPMYKAVVMSGFDKK